MQAMSTVNKMIDIENITLVILSCLKGMGCTAVSFFDDFDIFPNLFSRYKMHYKYIYFIISSFLHIQNNDAYGLL